jgi:hypothetical protein
MIIREIIWLPQFEEKIEVKHRISRDEVEEIFERQPLYRFLEKDGSEVKISIWLMGKLRTGGIYWSSSFTRVKVELW